MTSHLFSNLSWRLTGACLTLPCVFLLGACVENSAFSDLSFMNTAANGHQVGSSDYQGKGESGQVYQAKPIASEKLLVATGPLNVKEQSRAYDPAQAHLQARQKVNKNDFKKHNELSPHFKPDAQSGMDGVMRVLKVTGDTSFLDEENAEYAQVHNSVTKPSQTVAEVKGHAAQASTSGGFMQKLGALFSEKPQPVSADSNVIAADEPVGDTMASAYDGSGIIIPPRKPGYQKTTIQLSLDTQGSQVRYRVENGEVVLPPRTPKLKKQESDIATISQSSVQQRMPEESSDNLVEKLADLIKPDNRIAETERIASKSSGAHIKTKTIKFGEGALPVPGTKPNVPSRALVKSSYQSPPKFVIEKGQKSEGVVSVQKLRAGMHPKKVRLVIEVSGLTKYKATVDDIRNVLLVKLENTRWDIAPQASFSNNKLLGTYIAKPSSQGGTLLEVRLKKPTKITGSSVLDPLNGSGHRIIIDLDV